jgi:hypothetical protein
MSDEVTVGHWIDAGQEYFLVNPEKEDDVNMNIIRVNPITGTAEITRRATGTGVPAINPALIATALPGGVASVPTGGAPTSGPVTSKSGTPTPTPTSKPTSSDIKSTYSKLDGTNKDAFFTKYIKPYLEEQNRTRYRFAPIDISRITKRFKDSGQLETFVAYIVEEAPQIQSGIVDIINDKLPSMFLNSTTEQSIYLRNVVKFLSKISLAQKKAVYGFVIQDKELLSTIAKSAKADAKKSFGYNIIGVLKTLHPRVIQKIKDVAKNMKHINELYIKKPATDNVLLNKPIQFSEITSSLEEIVKNAGTSGSNKYNELLDAWKPLVARYDTALKNNYTIKGKIGLTKADTDTHSTLTLLFEIYEALTNILFMPLTPDTEFTAYRKFYNASGVEIDTRNITSALPSVSYRGPITEFDSIDSIDTAMSTVPLIYPSEQYTAFIASKNYDSYIAKLDPKISNSLTMSIFNTFLTSPLSYGLNSKFGDIPNITTTISGTTTTGPQTLENLIDLVIKKTTSNATTRYAAQRENDKSAARTAASAAKAANATKREAEYVANLSKVLPDLTYFRQIIDFISDDSNFDATSGDVVDVNLTAFATTNTRKVITDPPKPILAKQLREILMAPNYAAKIKLIGAIKTDTTGIKLLLEMIKNPNYKEIFGTAPPAGYTPDDITNIQRLLHALQNAYRNNPTGPLPLPPNTTSPFADLYRLLSGEYLKSAEFKDLIEAISIYVGSKDTNNKNNISNYISLKFGIIPDQLNIIVNIRIPLSPVWNFGRLIWKGLVFNGTTYTDSNGISTNVPPVNEWFQEDVGGTKTYKKFKSDGSQESYDKPTPTNIAYLDTSTAPPTEYYDTYPISTAATYTVPNNTWIQYTDGGVAGFKKTNDNGATWDYWTEMPPITTTGGGRGGKSRRRGVGGRGGVHRGTRRR